MEKHSRSLTKTISWRIVASSITILLVFLFTGNLIISAGIGSLEVLLKTVAYYLHERLWNASNFGREKPTGNLSTHKDSPENSSIRSHEDDQVRK